MRLAACQIMGTVIGLMMAASIGFALQPSVALVTGTYTGDILLIAVGALALNIPFYAAAVLISHTFAKSVIAFPKTWCLSAPGFALIAALIAFPDPEGLGISWLALIPLCALFAGVFFVFWQAKRPLTYVR